MMTYWLIAASHLNNDITFHSYIVYGSRVYQFHLDCAILTFSLNADCIPLVLYWNY